MQAEETPAGSGSWVADLYDVGPGDLDRAGGKAVALAALQRRGLRVPGGLCVLTAAYDRFVDTAGLRQAIALELGRKSFEDMRWEEVWDASLRIRNLFLRASPEPELAGALEEILGRRFGDGRPAVVRSTAPAEDTAATSFAGLHESYVNVRGVPALLDAVRQVWASLWTDRALLYRKELGLDVLSSSMAVVVQELISGEVSGVAFSQNPLDESQAVVEAVWGLNEGLVDGTIEPDRWIVERGTGTLMEHFEPVRRHKVASSIQRAPHPRDASGAQGAGAAGGTHLVELAENEQLTPPLSDRRLQYVVTAAVEAEHLFGSPQDVEWTVAGDELWILQSRPISTLGTRLQAEAHSIAHERAQEEVREVLGGTASPDGSPASRDERPWYVNLHRSFGTLRDLRYQVEQVAIPHMGAEADSMATTDLSGLSDQDLASEIARRREALNRWEETYYQDFIPLAHGVRLFGQVYNDKVRPADPYEFVDLLAGSGLLSVSRNAALEELADRMAREPAVPAETLDDYLDRFGSGPGTPEPVRSRERTRLIRLLSEMARQPEGGGTERAGAPQLGAAQAVRPQPADRAAEYLGRFQGEERRFQEDLLDLARASYRLRDDDNVHLGRFRRLVEAAMAEAQARAGAPTTGDVTGSGLKPEAAGEPFFASREPAGDDTLPAPSNVPRFKVRQLVGQPAGPGLAVGRARVSLDENDLYAFVRGEILVCDSLDPTMTFVAPLAAAIVERRGGMLVHGAIIAREYGLPCVTGVPDATQEIHTGDLLTVDGFLGIVVVGGTPPGTEQ